MGHALHWLHPIFKKYSFDERVKEVAFQLEYQEPAICQSMYIYKNPGTGSEGTYINYLHFLCLTVRKIEDNLYNLIYIDIYVYV